MRFVVGMVIYFNKDRGPNLAGVYAEAEATFSKMQNIY